MRVPTPSPETVARDVLDSLLEGCQVIGFDGRYVYVNEAVARQARCKPTDLVGRTMAECFPGIEATPMFARLRRCMQERVHLRMENEFTYPDGSRGWFELRFVPVPEGVCILSLDVSENKRAAAALERSEEQVRQMQKMEAIGRLAGGVAHDFNNILSVILSYTNLLLGDLEPGAARADVEEIEKAAKRAATLTGQLLAFGHQQVVPPRVVSVNDVVRDVEKMLRRLGGARVEIRLELGADAGRVMAVPGHLEQVLINLVVNARDAMPAGGRLTIETSRKILDAAWAAEHLGVTPGPHVLLAVRDTGIGMDRETQSRIFEPFFTTKPAGKGTGLGLTTVFGIVRQCQGSIWVYSQPGHGTTFEIYLPCTDRAATEPPARPIVSDDSGSETVLLVEDDDQLRAVAFGVLVRAGYRVLEARNGARALELCAERKEPIHLLLTDVVMPQMGGRELAQRVRELRPATRLLFMSGYTDDATSAGSILAEDIPVLQKPITPDVLLRGVREALGAPRAE